MNETKFTRGLDTLVSHIEYAGIRITPAASPIPAMVALGTVLSPVWGPRGWVIVGVIEVIGLAAGAFASYIHTYNQSGKGWVNPNWGWGVMVGYFLIVEAAIIAFKIVPAVLMKNPPPGSVTQAVATFLFPFLTLIGAVIIGIRIQMEKSEHRADLAKTQADEEEKHERDRKAEDERREQDRKDEQTRFDLETQRLKRDQDLALERTAFEHKLMLQQQRAATRTAPVAAHRATPVRNKNGDADKLARQQTLQHDLQQEEFIIPNQYAKRIGTHRSTVIRDLRELESAGLAHKNNKGWKPGRGDNEQHSS